MKRTNLVLMISAALTLAACGGNSSNDSAPSDPTPPKTAQPTPKPAPTPETSEQEAEKPEAKKPATGGSSGGSGGSYAGGGSYGGGGSSGGSSGSTGGAGGDTGGGDTGDTGDTGGDDKTGDKDGDEEKEQPAKELTDDQRTEFAAKDNQNNHFAIAEGTQQNPAKVKNADFAKNWSSFTVTGENGKKTTTVLIPTKAKENAFTDGSREIIETKDFTDFDGVQTASSKVIGTEAGTEFEGKTYISKEYTYSRFGSFTKGKFTEADDTFTFAADGENPTTYYSVGRIDLLPEDANKPPVTGKAKYEGIALIDVTDSGAVVNTIGDFKGDADFATKKFTATINNLKSYKNNSLDKENMGDPSEGALGKIYNNKVLQQLDFKAKIEGHNFATESSSDKLQVKGSFYGPEAAEVGGVISSTETDKEFKGAFGGDKIKAKAPAAE